ncbi:MAG: hypothetical protein ACD_46C00230G0002 [uncultured bacterium]|nr:MAG: hypothetical protein ACD_46C00230G0002 [uncultured bacterium]
MPHKNQNIDSNSIYVDWFSDEHTLKQWMNTLPITQAKPTGWHPVTMKDYVCPSWMKAASQAIFTSLGVATILYPLEIFQTRKQTFVNQKMPFTINSLALKSLWNGYLSSNKASLMKNSVMSNRDHVQYHVDKAFEKDNQQIHEEMIEKTHEEMTERKKFTSSFIASSIIGFFDTVSTQYWANLKIHQMLGQNHHFSFPEKFKFSLIGFPTRYTKNYLNAFFCLSTVTILNEPFNQLFPAEQYGITAPIFTTLTAGIASGATTNAIEVIYKNQVNQADIKLGKTPSAYQVAKALFHYHGPSVFMRGAGWNIVSTTIAYGVINIIDMMMNHRSSNDALSVTNTKVSSNKAALFAVIPLPPEKIVDQVQETNGARKKH